MTTIDNELDEILKEVFMAGLGIAGADDIDVDEMDKAILNTEEHYVNKAKQALTTLYCHLRETNTHSDSSCPHQK